MAEVMNRLVCGCGRPLTIQRPGVWECYADGRWACEEEGKPVMGPLTDWGGFVGYGRKKDWVDTPCSECGRRFPVFMGVPNPDPEAKAAWEKRMAGRIHYSDMCSDCNKRHDDEVRWFLFGKHPLEEAADRLQDLSKMMIEHLEQGSGEEGETDE